MSKESERKVLADRLNKLEGSDKGKRCPVCDHPIFMILTGDNMASGGTFYVHKLIKHEGDAHNLIGCFELTQVNLNMTAEFYGGVEQKEE